VAAAAGSTILLIIGGCGSADQSSGAGPSPVRATTPAGPMNLANRTPAGPFNPATVGAETLEVWTAETATRLQLVRKRADEFTAQYPNVKIIITVRDFGSYPAQLKLALTSDSAPDVAVGNLGWSLDGPLVKAGLLRNLDPWAKVYGWDRRYSQASQQQLRFTPDGKSFGRGSLFGVPYAADVIGWFYNVAKLKALKLELPTTLAELEAEFRTAKAAGEVSMMLGNRAQWPSLHVFYLIADNWASTLELSGIVYGDRGAAWNSPHLVDSATKLAQWYAQGYFEAGVNGMTPADANARFAKGVGVFLPAGSWNAAELSTSMGDNLGFFLTPPNKVGEPRRATGSFGYSWHITASSHNPDLAAAFIDFMTNEKWARELVDSGDIAPFDLKELGLQMQSKVTRDVFAAWHDVVTNDTMLPYLDSSAPNGSEVIYPTVQAILVGQQDPARGLGSIEAARQKFLATLQ
jgi:raffinose/stachyose/melibiose transport system substrate-binding protein